MTSLLSLLFLNGSFLKFFNNSGAEIKLNFNGTWQSTTEGTRELLQGQILITGTMVLIILISLTAIFLFKKRKLQMNLVMALIIISIAAIGLITFFAFSICTKYNADITISLGMFLPLLILLFNILAYLGIKKDENLVRSYDRLR